MLLVSMAVFLITEASPGNVAKNVLGAFITPEQESSFLAQMGLDKPVYTRYFYWLFGLQEKPHCCSYWRVQAEMTIWWRI